ncbi:hypothetical protein HMPREF3155_11925 [Corynebacterium sp. HMSC06D04]|uniref:chorismate-binding protein n=1 Tax=Corynebacterium sp. HMSC06D04 TaxID=1581123 RepID=UPI0008A1B3AE|nr:chorismate-binding protein [Corynebacterium sp. HMSC06D04]OFT49116.1 hypothetical protein HMPREF3155_11925 [Corynebacterium sp. HMSC06D04]
MNLLIVDNHDSFTFNLVDYVRRVTGCEPTVVPNDIPWARIDLALYDAAIISPGPGSPANPADLGISANVLREFTGPILGVCLGMQAMVHLEGGEVGLASAPAHGIVTEVDHDGSGLFEGLASPHRVVRYHSLVAHRVPECFDVTATCADTFGTTLTMAIAHRTKPQWGVQFHPESLLTDSGPQLFENFLGLARRYYARQYFCVRTVDKEVSLEDAARALTGNAFWLDFGRFSILGDDSGHRARHLSYNCQPGKDFFEVAKREYERHVLPARVGAPIPGCDFALGWVGYLGYEVGVEKQRFAQSQRHRSPGPDAEFIFCDRAIVVDHEQRRTHLLSFADDSKWQLKLATDSVPQAPWQSPGRLVHGEQEYLERIAAAQDYMVRGESYEVCLTNRIELEPVPNPLETFLQLRAANPSKRTGFLGFAGNALLSTSPEQFLSIDAWRNVSSTPIKGTSPRDTDPEIDAANARSLRGEKTTSELLMVVDMVRHDVARACDDVRVPHGFQVHSYSTVHQLMCEVTGRLKQQSSPIDAIEAAFPGGSMTGAPKERTMQIIDELEDTWRGVYSGAFGYLSLTGTADFSMVIRSVVSNERGAYYGVGGAVLAVSEPSAEWEETMVKARPLFNQLGMTPSDLHARKEPHAESSETLDESR